MNKPLFHNVNISISGFPYISSYDMVKLLECLKSNYNEFIEMQRQSIVSFDLWISPTETRSFKLKNSVSFKDLILNMASVVSGQEDFIDTKQQLYIVRSVENLYRRS